jgi:hypothetical protein
MRLTNRAMEWIDEKIRRGLEVTIVEGPVVKYVAHYPGDRDHVIRTGQRPEEEST